MIFPPPRRVIPRRVFDALAVEMEKRDSRTVDEWVSAERLAVLRTVNAERAAMGKDLVTENDVLKVERLATGHIDYMWKYAYGAEELVNR